MEIRYLKNDDDLFEISNIYEESWKYAYKQIIPQTYLDSIPKGDWIHRLKATNRKTIVMLENGSIIGTSSFCKSRFDSMNGYGEIISIYLLPNFIGKGYGKILLQNAVNELKNMGFNKVFLWVLEENKNARHFYEKFGFKLNNISLITNIGGRDLKEVQYELIINR